jgi:hypothetical protein
MNREELSKKLKKSKEKLQFHMERFNLLREEGKVQEALEELKVALNFAAQTLEFSNSILHQIDIDFINAPHEIKQNTLRGIEPDCQHLSKIRSGNPLLNVCVPDKKTLH